MSSTPAPAATDGRGVDPSEAGRRRWAVLAVVLVAAFMILLDATIVNVAVPTIGRDLRASDAAVQWVLAGYALAYGVVLIPAGRLGDRYGHRRVLIIGLVGFTATSALCGAAGSPAALVGWRIAQGAMAGVLNPPVLAIIRSVFPTRELGKAFGWYGAMAGVSTAAGPLLGGLLIAADLGGLDWRPIFLINVPVGVLTLALVLALVPEVRGRAGDLDPVGIALITAALLLLTVPLVQGRQLGWPAWTITCLVLVAPALAGFTAWERRRARRDRTPLVDVALFSQRSFAAGVAVALVHFAAFIGLVFTLSLYLQLGAGQSALSTGLVLMAFALGTLLSAAASDPLTDRLGRGVLLAGAALLAAGIAAALAALVLTPTPVVWWLIPGLAVAGIGNGLVIAPITTVVLAGVDRRDAGAASGVLNAAQRIGQAVGAAVLGLVLFTALATALTGGATPLTAYTHASSWRCSARWPPPPSPSSWSSRYPTSPTTRADPTGDPTPRRTMILITGATGTIGRALLNQLTATTGPPLRAMTRHPDTADLPPGVEVVGADLGDPTSLPRALAGIDKVFLLSGGPDGPRHDANLAAAAAQTGATHIVKLSALTVGDEDTHDPITTWHRAGEDAVRDSGVPWTFLRPTAFMSNALSWAATVTSHDTVYAPYGGGRTAIVDPRDIAAAATTCLTGTGHDGRIYPLTGPQARTPQEQVTILADVLGRPLRYVDAPPETVRDAMTGAGMPEVLADAVLALMATALQPSAATVEPTITTLTGHAPRTFAAWAHDHQASFTTTG